MFPFGVPIPATVPQRSEIPEGLMNYPVCVCVCVCVYIHTRTYIHTHTYTHTRAHTHILHNIQTLVA